MDQSDSYAGPFLTSREACDRAGFSRPDSFIRSWRAAGLPVYRRASSRLMVTLPDFEKFIAPDGISTKSCRVSEPYLFEAE